MPNETILRKCDKNGNFTNFMPDLKRWKQNRECTQFSLDLKDEPELAQFINDAAMKYDCGGRVIILAMLKSEFNRSK